MWNIKTGPFGWSCQVFVLDPHLILGSLRSNARGLLPAGDERYLRAVS